MAVYIYNYNLLYLLQAAQNETMVNNIQSSIVAGCLPASYHLKPIPLHLGDAGRGLTRSLLTQQLQQRLSNENPLLFLALFLS